MNEKKIPMRKCIGCGQMKDKYSLLRIVKGSNGEMIPDTLYRHQGRGAYLCKDKDCFASAKKSRRLDRALSARVSEENYDALYESFFEKNI